MANVKTTTAIAMLLIMTFAISMVAMPSANAHDPAWEFPSYAYLVASPNPIGVGQKASIVMWVDYPLPQAAVGNDIRRHDYTLTITAPNGDKKTEQWDVVQDTTSIQYYSFTPDQAGTYTLKFDYPKQTYEWDDPVQSYYGPPQPNPYTGDIFTAASKTATLEVQEEPLPEPVSSYPLPTEYWTRPIEGQNTAWASISSNWLGSGSPQIQNRFQPDGIAPNSPHIMWSRPIQDGGVVGGGNVGVEGNTYYMGGSYNVRWSNPIVMYGRLYYELPYGNSGGGGGWMCVDLRTGKTIWGPIDFGTTIMQFGSFTFMSSISPSFGYTYAFDDGNQHGVLPNGLLFTSNWGTAIDPLTGKVTEMNITRVPSGTSVLGPKGEILRYAVTNIGNSTNPNWRLTQWNSSKLTSSAGSLGPSGWYTGTIDASLSSRYDYNLSITLPNAESWSILRASLGDIMLLTQGDFGGRGGTYYGGDWYGANVTALNLNASKGAVGTVLWSQHYDAAPGNVTRDFAAWDPEAGVFVFEDKETLVHYGYSLATGDRIWGPTQPAEQYDYFRSTTRSAYGKIYYAGYGGVVHCYDIKTGDKLWSYGNGGPGNSTSSGLGTAWGVYPIFMPVIADGKLYLATTEHSPNSPYYKDVKYRCVNATDGTEIWTLMGWGTGMDANYDIVADGFFVFLNCYDMKVYCVGKGPSAMTVEAPKASITEGSSLVISGTVTDIAAGTQQAEQAARFPNGVPAMSDDNMGAWMEYVYMQKPRPTNATGVDVTLSVVDSNDNCREIGTVKSDANGFFSYQWTPDISGKYTVIASFAGSESYWPSQAETAFAVDPAPEVTPGPTPTPTSMSEAYFLPSVAGIIVAVAVVGAVIVLMLRKRP